MTEAINMYQEGNTHVAAELPAKRYMSFAQKNHPTVLLKDTRDSPLSYRSALVLVSPSPVKQEYFLHPFPFTS